MSKSTIGCSGVCVLLDGTGRQELPSGFQADLTPKQMLELGVFGGKYMTDCGTSFPTIGSTRQALQRKARSEAELLRHQCSQPLAVWREKGWIHKDDPRGWFQWYCRYYMGRRGEDDERQIKRWRRSPPRRASEKELPARRLEVPSQSNGRRCCIGRMIRERFEESHDIE